MSESEVGSCSRCGMPALRSYTGSSWWHVSGTAALDLCGPRDDTVHFVPDPQGKRDWFRWCRECDVKWWGQPTCWNCGGITDGAYTHHVMPAGHYTSPAPPADPDDPTERPYDDG